MADELENAAATIAAEPSEADSQESIFALASKKLKFAPAVRRKSKRVSMKFQQQKSR